MLAMVALMDELEGRGCEVAKGGEREGFVIYLQPDGRRAVVASCFVWGHRWVVHFSLVDQPYEAKRGLVLGNSHGSVHNQGNI